MAISAVSLVLWAALSLQLVYPDLVIDYPFMDFDSQDWIANGLRLAGSDVRYSVRPPLLPAAIATLERVSLLELLPVGILLWACAVPVGVYGLLRERCSRSLALAVGMAMLLNHSWLSLSLQVMADVPAACLLFAGTWCFLRAGNGHTGWLVAAGGLAGLSAVTQQLALLFPLAALAAALAHRRDLLHRWQLYAGAVLFTIPSAVWTCYKVVAFGTPGDVVQRNWSVVRLHADTFDNFLFTTASLLGVPGAVLAAVGLLLLVLGARRHFSDAHVTGLIVIIAAFFIFAYSHDAKRLLAYVFPLLGIAVAEALLRLPRRSLRWSATLLFAAGSVLPLPGTWDEQRWAAVWPAPPTYLRTLTFAQAQPLGLPHGALRLEVRGFGDAATWSVPSVVVRARGRVQKGPRLESERFRSDDSVVWVHDEQDFPQERYQVGLRLGNVLRKRIKHVTLDVVRPLRPWLAAAPAAIFEDLVIHRVVVSGSSTSWLVVLHPDGASAAWIAAPRDTPPEGAAPGLDTALRISMVVGHPQAVVLADQREGLTPLPLLPFVIRTPDLYVLDSQQFDRVTRAFSASAPRRLAVIDGVEVSEITATGRWFTLIDMR